LRRALLDYRGLFLDLLDSAEGDGRAPGLEADTDTGTGQVPAQRPWKQVTQGRHWKTRQQESSDVAASRP
jgi:hypothetical protein